MAPELRENVIICFVSRIEVSFMEQSSSNLNILCMGRKISDMIGNGPDRLSNTKVMLLLINKVKMLYFTDF